MNWFKKDPLHIITFKSYGTDSHFYTRGRALEDESIDLEKQSWIQLLINSWKRFETDEIKDTSLKLTLSNDISLSARSDDHGYYKVDEQLTNLTSLTDQEGWLVFEVSYNDKKALKRSIQSQNKFLGELLIPCANAEFGVISDIDDTIIHTGVVSTLKWRIIINSLLKSPAMRIPLKGAATFYKKLHLGISGVSSNPIFYVSHSPWNLYRYLDYFLNQNDFPKGPILLRSFNDIFSKKKADIAHKHREIINILNTYPHLKFILIGDSGEYDADIYLEIAQQYPKQVAAIYLRSVKHKKKMQRIKMLFENYNEVPVLLVKNSEQAIQHARDHGFIK